MNKVIFRCAKCKIVLSKPVVELFDRTKLCYVDQEDHIGPGFYAVVDDSFATNSVGHWVINLEDALNTALHSDRFRVHGCCGVDGERGNTVCLNNHEIGAEFSDCWMSHGLVFDPTAVEIRQVLE